MPEVGQPESSMMSPQSTGPTKHDATIGVVGPREMVERILLLGGGPEAQRMRLIGSSHGEEHESYEKLLSIADRVDVVLFTGPLQFDLARATGELPVPATYIPVNSASLYSGIIRGLNSSEVNPLRVSIDSITTEDVIEAYDDVGLATRHVHSCAYQNPESVGEFFNFHRRLYENGESSGALTTVQSVAGRLESEHIPVFRLVPSSNTIRLSLNTAALLGVGNKLEESQVVIIIVEIAASARPIRGGAANWHQELVLSVHRQLLIEIRGVGAIVTQRDESSFMITATLGSLSALTGNLTFAPFVSKVRGETGLAVEVGIGLGATASDAEGHAYLALERSRAGGSSATYLVGQQGKMLFLPDSLQTKVSAAPSVHTNHTLNRVIKALGRQADGQIVVDAARVASATGVTTRTARRMLASLVESGHAWPMPAVISPNGGRPRQQFRLLPE